MRNFLPVLVKFADLFFILLIFAISYFLFFTKLGGTSLAAWDEAWYAQIAKNVLQSRNPFLLTWNGVPYLDHPPLGFWLMAISFSWGGINEFFARLPSALSGSGSLLLVYFISKQLFGNRIIAFCSALILATMPWFWLRARTGNLDIPLVFFQLSTVYLALRAVNDKRFLFFCGLFFGLALYTKSLISLLLLPVLLFILFPIVKKITMKDWLFFFGAILLPIHPWYFVNYFEFGELFIQRNLSIALRSGLENFNIQSATLSLNVLSSLNYLHMGILLWYKLFIFASLAGVMFLYIEKNFRLIYLWLIVGVIAFSVPRNVELWHLIPLYPPIALLIPRVFEKLGNIFLLVASKLKFKYPIPIFASLVPLTLVVFTSFRLVNGLYKDIVREMPPSQEEILTKELARYVGVSYIDDEYLPVAIFYANRKVDFAPYLPAVFSDSPKPFLILTKDCVLERDEISKDKYQILYKNGDRILVRSKD